MSDSQDHMEGAPLIKPSSTDHPLYDTVVEACRTVYDPEIPVNIFDLGLIYTIEIDQENAVNVIMSLTAPGCPVAGEMPAGSKRPSRRSRGLRTWTSKSHGTRRGAWT